MKLKKESIMFKKTLLSAALLAASGGAAAAAVGTATEIVHGTEGATGALSVTSAAVSYVLGASYTQGDTVTLTWSNDLAAGVGHTALAISDGVKTIPLTVLSATANSVTYRAGAVPAGYDYAANQTLVTAAKNLLGSNQASGTIVTQTLTAATSTGLEIDAGSVPVQVAEFWDQYAVSVSTKADALIDVEAGRTLFSTAGGHDANEDQITVATSTAATYTAALVGGAAGLVADLTSGDKSTITINGDFSWMDSAAAGFAIDASLGGLSASSGGADIANAVGTSSVAADAVMQATNAAAPSASLFIATGGTKVLAAQSYTADVVLNWQNGSPTVKRSRTFSGPAGSWGLNGATISAYGIPNQASVTPFLWVQNAGGTSGEISGMASCDGVTTDLGSLGNAGGNSNTRVGPAVQAVMDGVATCALGSRYDVTLTVNAKSTDVTINAGYRVTAADGSNDRLSLETSDSLN